VLSVLAIVGAGITGIASAVAVAGTGATWHTRADALALPAADAPAATWNAWARRAADDALGKQAKALLDGDEAGFLAAVDPRADTLLTEMRRRFDLLHQLGPGRWEQQTDGAAKAIGSHEWRIDLRLDYCFGDVTCRMNRLVIETDWRLDEGHLVMTDLETTDGRQYGPRPWETRSRLIVAAGDRTVVAAPSRYDSRLTETVATAERAAAVADALGRWGGAPSRYVIFLASSDDWKTWYGTKPPDWSAGYYVRKTDNEVVVNALATTTGLWELLTHELTHASTLAGPRKGYDDEREQRENWWLAEGIADYAALIGRAVTSYDALPLVRRYVKGDWDGNPAVAPPPDSADLADAAARYGVACLSVRRIADVYGQDAMLAFWGKVMHEGLSLQDASTQALGASWSTVSADVTQYLRRV